MGWWQRAGNRGLVVVAVLLVAVALGVVVAMVVAFATERLPTGSRADIDGSSTVGGPSISGRHWFGQEAADALAAELALAAEGTGWCFGWEVEQQGSGVVVDSLDTGSNLGADVPATDCDQWVTVEVTYRYTSSNSAWEDNAEMEVRSSDFALATELGEHPAFDVSASDLLHEDLGHNEDDLIANTVAAIPLVMAEAGHIDPLSAAPVEATPDAGSNAPTDGVAFADAEGWGGSDAWRANRTLVLAGVLVALLGGAGLCLAASGFRPRPTPAPVRGRPSTSPEETT